MSIESHCEISAIYVKIFKAVIINVYRQPQGDFNLFLQTISTALDLVQSYKYIILGGDFNIKFNLNCEQTKALHDICDTLTLKSTVNFLTRGNNRLDNVFSNIEPENTITSKISLPFSDHAGIDFTISTMNNNEVTVNNHHKFYRPITCKGKNAFFEALSSTDWEFVHGSIVNSNEKFNLFHNHIVQSFYSSFPTKCTNEINKNERNINWFTNELKLKRNTLNLLHEVYLNNPTRENKIAFVNYRKIYRQKISDSKTKAHSDFIANSGNISKASWQVINSRRKIENSVTCPKSPDEANIYFVNIAEKLVKTAPVINNVDAITLLEFSRTMSSTTTHFSFNHVTFNQVRDVIRSLPNKKTRDAHDLSVSVIKDVREVIIYPLTKIFNECIDSSIFPDALKLAKVIPIHKKGDKNDLNNYRPISLLPVFSKIFEHLLKNQIVDFFTNNALFSKKQFGFRRGKSTCDAILTLTNFISECFENGEFCMTTFFDLTKAFDCVQHDILLTKLAKYNFSTESCDLLKSYLQNRSQFVSINGKPSITLNINYGVPQGSILGPILFLIYINDLPNNIFSDEIILYADDTTSINTSANFNDLTTTYKTMLSSAERWFAANYLTLNSDKTNTMVLTLRKHDFDNPESVKFLGIHIDKCLNWNVHVDETAKKLNKTIYCIRSLINCVTINVLRVVYFSLFQSHLSYGILAWGHSAQSKRLFKIQRRVIRIICKLPYKADCRSYFKELGILPLPSLYIYHCLLYLRSHRNNIKTNDHLHEYNTRNRNHLKPCFLRTEKSKNAINFYCIKFFNVLPPEIKNLPLHKFKSVMYKYLIDKSFYSFDEFIINDFFDATV